MTDQVKEYSESFVGSLVDIVIHGAKECMHIAFPDGVNPDGKKVDMELVLAISVQEVFNFLSNETGPVYSEMFRKELTGRLATQMFKKIGIDMDSAEDGND